MWRFVLSLPLVPATAPGRSGPITAAAPGGFGPITATAPGGSDPITAAAEVARNRGP